MDRPNNANNKQMDISIVIPVYNEKENLPLLFKKIKDSLKPLKKAYEVIFINDGSTDHSEEELINIYKKNKNVVVINLFNNQGKASALDIGFDVARGEYIANIDSDLQCDPVDIPRLIQELDNGYDVATGNRKYRNDSISVVLTSKIFHMIIVLLSGLKIDDYFSGLKCYKRNVIQYLALFGDLYRFAPVYAYRQGFKVSEIPISHTARYRGKSKYNSLSRLRMAVADLLTIFFTLTINRKRIYYISFIGLAVLSLASLLSVTLFILVQINIIQISTVKNIIIVNSILWFCGVQSMVFSKLSNDFFRKHQDERVLRKRNIKNFFN
jgi:glycosyltransferase involved in cell wall biosynthesis